MALSQVTVTDATTNAPIVGATVYVQANPAVASAQTDASGNAQVDASGTVLAVQVTATGYDPWTAAAFSSSVSLVATAPAAMALTFTVNPVTDQSNPTGITDAPTSGADFDFSSSTGTLLESLSVDDEGLCMTDEVYPDGPYQVSISAPGFTSIVNQAVTISGGGATFTLVKSAAASPLSNAAAQAAVTKPASTAAPISPNTPLPTNPDKQYEYIYPNSADGLYFQAAQARMYIGNMFIDELVTCQFQLMQNRIPIYGYRSKKFDAVGTGHSLVQGQIAINFVTEGYLYVVLKEHDRLMASKIPSSSAMSSATQVQINALLQQYQAAYTSEAKDPIISNLLALAATDSTGAISEYIKAAMMQTPSNNGENACYLEIPFDLKVQLAGGGRTATRTIRGCVLGANDFAYSHDGKTILDTYSFIGRELV